MNGRLYDPVLGRMLSPDPYIMGTDNTQGYNRYTYALNNPLKYTDPDGEWVQFVVGAVVGGFSGWQIGGALGKTRWDRFWYTLGGAIVGGISGGIGGAISTSGVPMANTLGIMGSSLTNSIGTHIYTGGQTDISMSMGVASFNFSTGSFGYLGKKGNSALENIGYGFGALANIQDGFALTSGTSLDVKSRPKLTGHSEINGQYNGNDILISVGPQQPDPFPNIDGMKWEYKFFELQMKGTPYPGENVSYIKSWHPQLNTKLNNVNGNLMLKWTNKLNSGHKLLGNSKLIYGLNNGCINFTSRALMYSGVFNFNAFLPLTAPVLLNFELAIRNAGIIASPILINR